MSPYVDDGILGAGCAILAFIIAYYQRFLTDEGCNYPPYYCLIEKNGKRVCSRTECYGTISRFGIVWQFLDIWPESQWISVDSKISHILKTNDERRITRLFWTEGYKSIKNHVILENLPSLRSLFIFGKTAGNSTLQI